ncbi:MAG: ion transporter [Pseudohongiellaceae bacterium]
MNDDTTGKEVLKSRVYDVIFGYESTAGKLFDIVLICLILASVVAVTLDSISSIHLQYGSLLYRLEWFFTILFTLEYALRIYSSPHPRKYVFSFYGIIDLLSILPTYLALLIPGSAYLIVIRILRVLRIFRILKLFRYIGEANVLATALIQSRRKIFVFLFSLLTLMVIFGTVMFVIEGPEHGFSSIPRSIYWSIVTVTTVGYGDIAPQTPIGQIIASLAMICGYAIIAIPTGIVGAELMNEFQRRYTSAAYSGRICKQCACDQHELDARFCKMCGASLD